MCLCVYVCECECVCLCVSETRVCHNDHHYAGVKGLELERKHNLPVTV